MRTEIAGDEFDFLPAKRVQDTVCPPADEVMRGFSVSKTHCPVDNCQQTVIIIIII